MDSAVHGALRPDLMKGFIPEGNKPDECVSIHLVNASRIEAPSACCRGFDSKSCRLLHIYLQKETEAG